MLYRFEVLLGEHWVGAAHVERVAMLWKDIMACVYHESGKSYFTAQGYTKYGPPTLMAIVMSDVPYRVQIIDADTAPIVYRDAVQAIVEGE